MPMQKVVCAASVLVATTLTPALVPPASGAVLCQKKSGVVVVRAACKKKETALDLAQFGAVGPKGTRVSPGRREPMASSASSATGRRARGR